MNKKLKIVLLVLCIVVAGNFLIRSGYRYTSKKEYLAAETYYKDYLQKDPQKECINIATGKDKNYSATELSHCQNDLKFNYGFPLHFRTIGYQGRDISGSRDIEVIDYIIVILVYLLVPAAIILLLWRLIKNRK